jgi:hypothetical protein
MKKIPFFNGLSAIFSVLFLVSCNNMTVTTGDGSNKVVGNGKLVSEKKDINSFDQIDIEGVFNVILTQGDHEAVKVETDENIQPLILVSIDNNVLSVKMKDSISIDKMKKINVFITLVNINKLSSVGVGSIKCTNRLMLQNFEFINKGVGATELNVSADKFTVRSETVGALFLSGEAKDVVIKNEGVGVIKAFDLKAEKVSLHSDGIGAAEVYASDELSIHANGMGGIQYKGHPKVKNIKNEGLCKVEEVE